MLFHQQQKAGIDHPVYISAALFYMLPTIRETIRKDLEVNELDPNLVYDRTLWRNLIHVTDPT